MRCHEIKSDVDQPAFQEKAGERKGTGKGEVETERKLEQQNHLGG